MNKTNKMLTAILLLLATTAAFITGRITAPETITNTPVTSSDNEDVTELRSGEGYKFINPLLECDNYRPSKINSVVSMESEVRSYIQKIQNERKASYVSVYFRSLNLGPWMGINEKEKFSPASLLKVPIMIAALKKAEADPAFLKKKLAYTQHLDKNTVPNLTDSVLIKVAKAIPLKI